MPLLLITWCCILAGTALTTANAQGARSDEGGGEGTRSATCSRCACTGLVRFPVMCLPAAVYAYHAYALHYTELAYDSGAILCRHLPAPGCLRCCLGCPVGLGPARSGRVVRSRPDDTPRQHGTKMRSVGSRPCKPHWRTGPHACPPPGCVHASSHCAYACANRTSNTSCCCCCHQLACHKHRVVLHTVHVTWQACACNMHNRPMCHPTTTCPGCSAQAVRMRHLRLALLIQPTSGGGLGQLTPGGFKEPGDCREHASHGGTIRGTGPSSTTRTTQQPNNPPKMVSPLTAANPHPMHRSTADAGASGPQNSSAGHHQLLPTALCHRCDTPLCPQSTTGQ